MTMLTKVTSKKNTVRSAKKLEIDCHTGPVEVHPGLWLGDQDEGEKALELKKADIAVPLNVMSGSVWSSGWDGNIIYVPITDFSVLPPKVAIKKSQLIVSLLRQGANISMFCFGGHGRTGYFAALVLGMIGYEDPIAFLRKNYCEKAVESRVQIKSIAMILDKPELNDHKLPSLSKFYGDMAVWEYIYEDDKAETEHCGKCAYQLDCGKNLEDSVCDFYVSEGYGSDRL